MSVLGALRDELDNIAKLLEEKGREETVTFYYEVKGNGDFPCDMLRYEQSYPCTESDAYRIQWGGGNQPKRRIKLARAASERSWQPNRERWKSFGWPVVNGPNLEEF